MIGRKAESPTVGGARDNHRQKQQILVLCSFLSLLSSTSSNTEIKEVEAGSKGHPLG